jgi:hypothetical protein
MKKNTSLALVFLATIGMVFNGCVEERKEIGEPFDKVEGISGTWIVSDAAVIDEQSVLKDEIDITDFYTSDPGNVMELIFDGVTMTYQVTPGEGINFFGTGGTWEYDDPNFPEFLYLYTQVEMEDDTIVLQMGTTVNEFSSSMDIKYPRYCGENNVSSYRYTFLRQ